MFKDIATALWAIVARLKELNERGEEPFFKSLVTVEGDKTDGSTPSKVGIDLDSIVWYQYFEHGVLDVELSTGRRFKFYGDAAYLLILNLEHNRESGKIRPAERKKNGERALDTYELDHDPFL